MRIVIKKIVSLGGYLLMWQTGEEVVAGVERM